MKSYTILEARSLTDGKPHRPLRTAKELCEEVGINTKQFGNFIRWNPGLKPVIRHTAGRSRGPLTYYDPKEFRAWWKEVCSKKENC